MLGFGGSECGLVDEAHQLAGFFFGGFFVGGEAALGEIVGDGVAVGAADLEGGGELLHDAHELGLGDGGGEDGEVGEGIGDVGAFCGCGLCGVCWLLGCERKAEEEGEGGGVRWFHGSSWRVEILMEGKAYSVFAE
jgi:hypothetical protein